MSERRPPGAGRPVPDLHRPMGPMGWAVAWARREGADLTAMLPLALAMRREREQLVDAVPSLPTEAAVRALVADFNARLDAGYRRPQGNPPLATPFVEVERQVERWRQARPAPAPPSVPPDVAAAAARPRGPRAWWSRRPR